MTELKSIGILPLGGPLPHDPDGKLLRMGLEASAMWADVVTLPTSDPKRKEVYEKVTAMRLEEKEGWRAVRTKEFPQGDLVGVAKASLVIACLKLEQGEIEEGSKWLEIALSEVPENNFNVRFLICFNMAVLESMQNACSASSTPVSSGRSSPVEVPGGEEPLTSTPTGSPPQSGRSSPAPGAGAGVTLMWDHAAPGEGVMMMDQVEEALSDIERVLCAGANRPYMVVD